MSTPLLLNHRLTLTSDIEQAREEVAARFCAHRLSVMGRDTRLDMEHNAARIGRDITVNYMRYGPEVHIVPGTLDDFFALQVPLRGTARVKAGTKVVASSRHVGSLCSPTEAVDMIWSDGCEQLLIYIARRAVEEFVADELDHPAPVVFTPAVDLHAATVRAWMRLITLAIDELEANSGLLSAPLAANHFEQTLLAGLFAMQPRAGTSPVRSEPVPSLVVRTVTDLIQDRPEEPWNMGELSRRAGASPRTIQRAFQLEMHVSPLEYLRRTRLSRARQELLTADPVQTSVTEVAARWGFFHLGRFSQAYHATYRELPSQTLASR
jgi:AraC-like DNA-binding protein